MNSFRYLRVTMFTVCIMVISLVAGGMSLAENSNAEIIFCKSFSDDLTPQDTATIFETNIVSFLLYNKTAFGTEQLTLSIYMKSGAQEEVLMRESVDIRPAWNIYGMKNLVLPGAGEYILSFSAADGKQLAEAAVTVGAEKKDAPVPKTETHGATLKQLFEKYAPQK
jgi:hypothetical protein